MGAGCLVVSAFLVLPPLEELALRLGDALLLDPPPPDLLGIIL